MIYEIITTDYGIQVIHSLDTTMIKIVDTTNVTYAAPNIIFATSTNDVAFTINTTNQITLNGILQTNNTDLVSFLRNYLAGTKVAPGTVSTYGESFPYMEAIITGVTHIAGESAIGGFTITGVEGSPGEGNAARITVLTITLADSVDLNGCTTPTLVAQAIKTAINLLTETHGFVADGDAAIITLTAPTSLGSTINTESVDIAFESYGISTSVVAFSEGVSSKYEIVCAGLTTTQIAYFTQAGITPAFTIDGKAFVYSARHDVVDIVTTTATITIPPSDITGIGVPEINDILVIAYNTLTITHNLDSLATINNIYFENVYGTGEKKYVEASGLSAWTVTNNSIVIDTSTALTSPSLVWKASALLMKINT